MTRTSVMQVTHDLGVGGLPGVVATLARHLDRERFDVSVLCLNERGPLAEDLEADGISVHLIGRDGAGPDYLAFRKVAAVLREERVDVVHTHNTQPFIDGGFGAVLARTPTHIHTDHARQFPDKWRYLMAERLLARFAHRVVGVSEHTSRMLEEEVGISAAKIVTVPNGIEDPLEGHRVDPAEKRKELGIDPDALVVGVGVRLAQQKGLTHLLDAMPGVAERLPRARLVIAGYGPLREALERKAGGLGLEGTVRFLGRRLDMTEVMQVFDLYALPSLWEGLPLVVLEAMAVGCPIVASDVGGVSSAVLDGRNGVLVPPRRPAELAEAIVRVLGDEDRRRQFGRAGRSLYLERFSAPGMARRYESLYLRRSPDEVDRARGHACGPAPTPAGEQRS